MSASTAWRLLVPPMLCASACCPIPMDQDIVIFPAATFVVRDGDGEAIDGARILVHAETQPHATDSDPTIELITDAEGRAILEERVEEQRVFPLMMHGVPGHSWSHCVDHPQREELGAALGPRLYAENHAELVTILAVRSENERGTCVGDAQGVRIQSPRSQPAEELGKSPNPVGSSAPETAAKGR